MCSSFPSFDLDIVTVRVIWSGSSAEDVEDGITNPLEQRLRTVENLYKLTSTSTQGISSITLEFEEGTDPLLALDEVRRLVDEFRNFPRTRRSRRWHWPPATSRWPGADHGPEDPAEMRRLARRFESELLDRGIDKVEHQRPAGGGDQHPGGQRPLRSWSSSLDGSASGWGLQPRSAGGLRGPRRGGRELRSLDKRRDALEFAPVPVKTEDEVRIDLGRHRRDPPRPRDGGVLAEQGRRAGGGAGAAAGGAGELPGRRQILRSGWRRPGPLPPGSS